MKISRQRHQTGSVRKIPRAHGFAWEFRYYHTDPDGVRRAKVQTFNSVTYPTERDVRLAVQGQLASLNADNFAGRVNVTFGMLIDRYLKEEFLSLRHSTQTTNKSLLELHIRPRWDEHHLADVTANKVKQWLDLQKFGGASKVRARNMISNLLDLAMLWEYLPVQRNPMELVRVKGSYQFLSHPLLQNSPGTPMMSPTFAYPMCKAGMIPGSPAAIIMESKLSRKPPMLSTAAHLTWAGSAGMRSKRCATT